MRHSWSTSYLPAVIHLESDLYTFPYFPLGGNCVLYFLLLELLRPAQGDTPPVRRAHIQVLFSCHCHPPGGRQDVKHKTSAICIVKTCSNGEIEIYPEQRVNLQHVNLPGR